MVREDRVCNNCGKRYGQHYGKLCYKRDSKIFEDSGYTRSKYGRITNPNQSINNPNTLFRKKKLREKAKCRMTTIL